MATKRPAKPRRTLLQEASDPSTAPERLRELAEHKDEAVHQAACRNPSLPEDVWRKAVLNGWPEAWSNPMAPIYLLTWTPREDDRSTLEEAAWRATYALWKDPKRCSLEGKVLLVAKVQEWWATSESASSMMLFLGWWAQLNAFLGRWAEAKGKDSAEHQEVLRILVLCVRMTPNLTDQDRQVLDLLKAWSAGGEDQRKKAKSLALSKAVKDACRFAEDSCYSSRNAIYEVLWTVEDKAGKEASAEHERLLADLIRGEMPLPPMVA